MKLSIVIVNYNVKYFLEQCLYSVRRASEGLDPEVIVVDNNSVDGSLKMVSEKFPEVILIRNKENLGFSKANNQAIRIAKGEYILLLNPDTVMEDDTLQKIVHYMDQHPKAGGLGVKMIDGKGNFLPESKRGLPKPDVAFYKVFGLSKLFPKSRVFGKYHLGFLDPDQIHEVDILSGAFMMVRKTILDKIGLLDETFFMYGEDIDLSYRITSAGYRNIYFPETRIIHYKGESTKKGSINYVLVFYRAMIIFAKKHFSHKNARTFSFLISLAIYFRATLAILNRFFSKALLPLLDATFIFIGIYFIQDYWEQHVIFPGGGHYPVGFTIIVLPLYVLTWLVSSYLSSVYDRPVKLIRIFQGIALGTVFILVIYALLPEKYRFSRAIILLGAAWGLIVMTGVRIILHLLKFKAAQLASSKNRRFIIIGDRDEAIRVSELLQKSYNNPGFIGLVSITGNVPKNDGFIGSIDQVKEIIQIYKIDELIFCSKSLPHQAIIDQMSALQDMRVDYKIAPEDSLSIIGSNSINTAGDLYTIHINSITKANNRRNKRFLDTAASLIFLVISPVLVFLIHQPLGLFRNILMILFGKRSWVGYHYTQGFDMEKLPHIRKGVLDPADAFKNRAIIDDTTQQLNFIYARDYDILSDMNIIIRGYKNLGRKS
jgi:GT2 family glycosyltransferase